MNKKSVKPGDTYGKWIVLKEAGRTKDRRRQFLCRCTCGTKKTVVERYLTSGQSLGCSNCRYEDLTGKRFGKLTALELAYKKQQSNGVSKRYWKCICDCGNHHIVRDDNLKAGISTHCGCSRLVSSPFGKITEDEKEEYPHYKDIGARWYAMKQRCYNPNEPSYKNYGARGIIICDEWKDSFRNFYYWAIENGFQKHLTIERINNDSNYCPENCKWATTQEQNQNTRGTKINKDIVATIRAMNNKGISQLKIADICGLSVAQISRIINNKAWKDDDYKPEYSYKPKLTDKEIHLIRELVKNGVKQSKIARTLKISSGYISSIVNNKVRTNI